jgi:DNA repair photolyase
MIKEIQSKTILRKMKKIESWFISHHGMNLYRGCTHNCVYCDGRADRYYVEGDFGKDVTVKTNAIEILKKELDPSRKRKPMKKAFLVLGGGVGDCYQPAEAKYQLARKTLELLRDFKLPVHVLTKSILVERDLDILQQINRQNRAIVSCSFSSVDDDISAIFEPSVPPPSLRLEMLKRLKMAGISIGMYFMPVIPFITDTPDLIEKAIQKAQNIGIDFIIFGGMTLKSGRQKKYFLDVLKGHYPQFLREYEILYPDNDYGQAQPQYYHSLNQVFFSIIKNYNIPVRIPPTIYSGIVSLDDKVIIILEHIDYLLKSSGRKSPYGYAAWSLSQLKEPFSNILWTLDSVKGVGACTKKLVQEIIETGRCRYYEELLYSQRN